MPVRADFVWMAFIVVSITTLVAWDTLNRPSLPSDHDPEHNVRSFYCHYPERP